MTEQEAENKIRQFEKSISDKGLGKYPWGVRPYPTREEVKEHYMKEVDGAQEKPSALTRQEGGSHYKGYPIQPVEFITKNKLTFLEGCVIKRVCRHRLKNLDGDILKAIHELELILLLEYPDAYVNYVKDHNYGTT